MASLRFALPDCGDSPRTTGIEEAEICRVKVAKDRVDGVRGKEGGAVDGLVVEASK